VGFSLGKRLDAGVVMDVFPGLAPAMVAAIVGVTIPVPERITADDRRQRHAGHPATGEPVPAWGAGSLSTGGVVLRAEEGVSLVLVDCLPDIGGQQPGNVPDNHSQLCGVVAGVVFAFQSGGRTLAHKWAMDGVVFLGIGWSGFVVAVHCQHARRPGSPYAIFTLTNLEFTGIMVGQVVASTPATDIHG